MRGNAEPETGAGTALGRHLIFKAVHQHLKITNSLPSQCQHSKFPMRRRLTIVLATWLKASTLDRIRVRPARLGYVYERHPLNEPISRFLEVQGYPPDSFVRRGVWQTLLLSGILLTQGPIARLPASHLETPTALSTLTRRPPVRQSCPAARPGSRGSEVTIANGQTGQRARTRRAAHIRRRKYSHER